MHTSTLLFLPLFLIPSLFTLSSASPLLHRHRKSKSALLETLHRPSENKIHKRQSYGVIDTGGGGVNDVNDPEDPDFPTIPGFPDLDDPDFPAFPPFPPFPPFPVPELPDRGGVPTPDPAVPAPDPTTPPEADRATAGGCSEIAPALTVTQVQVQKEIETKTVTSTVEVGGFLDGLFGDGVDIRNVGAADTKTMTMTVTLTATETEFAPQPVTVQERKTEVVTATVTHTQPVTETKVITNAQVEIFTVTATVGGPNGISDGGHQQHELHDGPGPVTASAPGVKTVSEDCSGGAAAKQTPPPPPPPPLAPEAPEAPAIGIPPTAEHHHDHEHAHNHDSDVYGNVEAANNRDFRDLGVFDIDSAPMATAAPSILSPTSAHINGPAATSKSDSYNSSMSVPLSIGGVRTLSSASSSPYSLVSSLSSYSSSSSSAASETASSSSVSSPGGTTTTITSTTTRTFRRAPMTVTNMPEMPIIEDDLKEEDEWEYHIATAPASLTPTTDVISVNAQAPTSS